MKRKLILIVCMLALLAGFLVPALHNRMTWEHENQVYVTALDVTRVAKYFSEEEMPAILESYRDSGVTTAIVCEIRGSYDERMIRMAQEAGMNICLAPDISFAGDAGLEYMVQNYDVQYIKLQNSVTKSRIEAVSKAAPVCRVLEEYGLTLVLCETNQ